MSERGLRFNFQFRHDPLSQCLSQLHSPLVEAVNVPKSTLAEDQMFIKGDEPAEDFWRQSLGQYCV